MNMENYILAKRRNEIRKRKANKIDYETLKRLNEEIEKSENDED